MSILVLSIDEVGKVHSESCSAAKYAKMLHEWLLTIPINPREERVVERVGGDQRDTLKKSNANQGIIRIFS